MAVLRGSEQPKLLGWDIQLVRVNEYTPGFKPILKVPWTQQPATRTQVTGTVRGRPDDGVTRTPIWS